MKAEPAPPRSRTPRFVAAAVLCACTVIASILYHQGSVSQLFLRAARPTAALRAKWRVLVERSLGGDYVAPAVEDPRGFTDDDSRFVQGGPEASSFSETPEWLQGTAIVTLAAGDDSGRLAVALVQSLRDAGTQVPTILVMLARGGRGSDDCKNATWMRQRGRQSVQCHGPDTVAGEIVSQRYLDALDRLGAATVVVDSIPVTEWTSKIPGGRTVFWGMAFQKLHVFNMTQFRKLLWVDADAMVLRNIDHLLREPTFTAAYTHACCNPNAPAVPSGGLWVVEPSLETGVGLWRMMSEPLPGSTANSSMWERYWMYGDMQLVRYFFGNLTARSPNQPLWPFVEDSSHGTVPNLRVLPQYANASEAAMAKAATWRHGGYLQGQRLPEGFRPEWSDGSRPMFRVLDGRYDQCVGMCECLPQRDMPDQHYSVHFSCLNGFKKPSEYGSELELAEKLHRFATGCQRHYFWKWYEFFRRGYGRLPPPYWEGPPIPGYNASHDELVAGWRAERDEQDKAAAAAKKKQ